MSTDGRWTDGHRTDGRTDAQRCYILFNGMRSTGRTISRTAVLDLIRSYCICFLVRVEGIISSMDDYYQTSSGLVVMETTNSILNSALYDLITPQSLLSALRVRVANMLAHSGEEWYHAVSKYNSGLFHFFLL